MSDRLQLLTRLTSAVYGAALDRALARGADPARSAPLAHRAARLTGRDTRLSLATRLESLLDGGDRRPNRFRVSPSPQAVVARPRSSMRAGSRCSPS